MDGARTTGRMHGAGHLHDHDGRCAGEGAGKPVELLEARFGGEVVEEFGDADAGNRARMCPPKRPRGCASGASSAP